jgi:hypothetical protein
VKSLVELDRTHGGSWHGRLTEAQMAWCLERAGWRDREDILRGRKPIFVPEGMTTLQTNEIGLRGEVFVALAEGKRRLNCTVFGRQVYNGPDVGAWEVKTTRSLTGPLCLSVRQSRHEGARQRPYLLVSNRGAECWIRGWQPGTELIQDANLKELRYGPAYVATELLPYEPPA